MSIFLGDEKMRKILFIFTICLVYSFSNICLAHWLPKSELFVGGVGPGCTLEYVASVYGQPKEKRWFNSDGVRGVHLDKDTTPIPR